jgi:hypothetical protein
MYVNDDGLGKLPPNPLADMVANYLSKTDYWQGLCGNAILVGKGSKWDTSLRENVMSELEFQFNSCVEVPHE